MKNSLFVNTYQADGEVVSVIQVAGDSAAANVIDLEIVATYD